MSSSTEIIVNISTTQLRSSHSERTNPSSASTVSGTFAIGTGSTSVGTGSIFATATQPFTMTKPCEEMQAVDEITSKKIVVRPVDVRQEDKPKFQPTSPQGVSFRENETKPTIIVTFDKPAEVQSVTIPRDKTPGANVQQFGVIFYSPDGQKINDKPVFSTSSPRDDNTKPARIDSSQTPSNTLIFRLEIIVVSTIDNKSPKAVVLEIKACTESMSGMLYFLSCWRALCHSIYIQYISSSSFNSVHWFDSTEHKHSRHKYSYSQCIKHNTKHN